MIAIKLENIKKTYPSRPPVEALKGCSLEIKEGDTVVLLGPNGAGKTTLLKILIGILLPDSGKVTILGNDSTRFPSKTAAFLRFLAETPFILRNNNLWENALFWFNYWKERYPKEELENIFSRLNLSGRAKEPLSRYSRGMLQKSVLSFMLATRAPIIVLDEPTLGLDVVSVKEVIEIIKEIKSKNKTIIIASHAMSFVREVAETVVLIDNGRILEVEDINLFVEKFGNPRFIISYKRDGNLISETFNNTEEWNNRLRALLTNNIEIIEFRRETESLEQILCSLFINQTRKK